uniref:F-box domain-containing protein n=1 Tax=Arundo donax TaxID=35708 RepID=A0A0A9B2C0_ARUDO
MPRRPPALMEELVEAILLRFPPEEPALLFRAALVCKGWCRLISSTSFRRRFRELHRTAPMLGFFHRDFVPNSSFPRLPHAIAPNWRAVDALHGRILFHDTDLSKKGLVVFNPMTGEVWRLPRLQVYMYRWSAALLCAAAGCDHLVCGGPFLVVFVGKEPIDGFVVTSVYSSVQDAWSEPISVQNHGVWHERAWCSCRECTLLRL